VRKLKDKIETIENPIHTAPQESKNAHFGFLFEETSIICREIAVFENVRFEKCFPSTRKRKAGYFKFLWFEERFRKEPLW